MDHEMDKDEAIRELFTKGSLPATSAEEGNSISSPKKRRKVNHGTSRLPAVF